MQSQALDADLQEAEDQQLEAHNTHAQTLTRLVETQAERIDTTALKYEEERKVHPICRAESAGTQTAKFHACALSLE